MNTTTFDLALKHGAKITQVGSKWHASQHVRGRSVALFVLIRDTKEEAADAYCEYMHLEEKVKKT